MALSSKILQTDLYNIFESMNKIETDCDEYFAINCARAITTYVSSGNVSTNDTGTGSVGGLYVGVGTGNMTINMTMLSSLLFTTFKLKSTNDILALNIAMNIDSVCKVPNTVKTDTIGASTIGSSPPYTDKGKGLGNLIGTPTLISTKLSNCFLQMNTMEKDGNLFLSQEFASAIDIYFKSAVINTTLQFPMSGSGVGKIS